MDLRVGRILDIGPDALDQQRMADVAHRGFEFRRNDGVGMTAFFRKPLIAGHAIADARLRARDQRFHAFDRLIERARRNQTQEIGYANFVFRRFTLEIGKTEDREGRRRRLRLPHRLDRGDLHLLVLARRIAALIAEHDDRKRGGETEARRDRQRAASDIDMTTIQNEIGGDRHDKHRARDIAGADRVHEFRLRHGIEQHFGEGRELHAHRLRIKCGADRVLHPGVGDENPERREIGAERD
ncbi:MAG: hypothetical protein FD172_1317 [Methylocystaceae bacterium]|nr:MAG: hypothetical protein FD172_1317 [Methylocystaceae bacterium]